MNIPKKTQTEASNARIKSSLLLGETVLSELQELVKVLSDRVIKPANTKNSVLLARLVENLSTEEWLSLSQKHNLRSWLAMPIGEDAAKAVNTLAKTLDKLVFQRDHDPLTGLANRRYFEHSLTTELERAARTNGSLSLIMLDLDNFKRVNDTYGHLCGDKVLQKLGNFLSHSRRSYDLTARYGGEEFTIILPGIPFQKAKVTAQRLLSKFSQIEFKCGNHDPFCVTFSAGIAGVSPKTGYNFSAEQLIQMSDEALYAAKRNGRNRVEVSECSVEAITDTMVLVEEKQFLFKDPE